MNAVQKYEARVNKVDSLLCVGLDPEFDKIPVSFRESDHPLLEFNKFIIEATHAYTASYKLNIAFFEARGSKGFEELKLTAEYLQSKYPDILLLCDAKRGDIRNTNIQNAISSFDYFGFDGVTVHPYMGDEPLAPFFERSDKAIIVLCLNRGGSKFQTLMVGAKPLWQLVAEMVCVEWNKFGNCMLVIGANSAAEMSKARALAGEMTFLVPGVGAQGGDLESTVRAGLNSQRKGLIIVAARSIIFSENPGIAAAELRDSINRVRYS